MFSYVYDLSTAFYGSFQGVLNRHVWLTSTEKRTKKQTALGEKEEGRRSHVNNVTVQYYYVRIMVCRANHPLPPRFTMSERKIQ